MNIFKDLFKKSLEEQSMKVLQDLGKKYMNGLSTTTDIIEWEANLNIIIEGKNKLSYMPNNEFISGMEELFTKYKIKHYPNIALSIIKNNKKFNDLRNGLYREMILIGLSEVPWIIHKWEYDNKDDYEYIIELIGEYIYQGRRREVIVETERCTQSSDDELISLLNIIRRSVLDYTPEQKEWHKKIDNLHTFKIENMPKLRIKKYTGSLLKLK